MPRPSHRFQPSAKVLTGSECAALERAELAWIFESLRAAVHVPFDFPNFVRVIWGFSNLQYAANKLPDFPDFRRLTELQQVFQEAGTRPVSKASCVRVLLSLVELKQWSLGIVYLSNREGTTDVLYLGVPAAKLVLLVRHMPQEEVDVWVAGASAYKTGMTTTTSVRMLRPDGVLEVETEENPPPWRRSDCSEPRPREPSSPPPKRARK